MKPNWINSLVTSSEGGTGRWAKFVRSPIGQAVGGWLKGPQNQRCLLPGERSVALSEGRLEPNRQRARVSGWQRIGPRGRDQPGRPRVRRRQEFREDGGGRGEICGHSAAGVTLPRPRKRL